MAVEINQNEQINHLNEKTQETPSFDEFASLNMDSVNMDSHGDIQVITDDCFIEDDIDKVTAFIFRIVKSKTTYTTRQFRTFCVTPTSSKNRFTW